MYSNRLIAQANEFMDGITIDSAKENLDDYIRQLNEFKEKMVRYGFDVPYLPMISLRKLASELERDDLLDIKKQFGILKYEAFLKKMTLRRTRVALASHYLLNSIFDDELKQHLPVDGNYVSQLLRLPLSAVDAYYTVNKWLKGRRQPYVLLTFEQRTDQGVRRETVRLNMLGEDAVNRAKTQYGDNIRIISTRKVVPKPLITDASVRVALATAVTSFAYNKVDLPDPSERLSRYNRILREHGFVEDVVVTDDELFGHVVPVLVEEGFLREDPVDMPVDNPFREDPGRYRLDPAIVREINLRNRMRKTSATGTALRALSLPLLKHYILKTGSARESDNGGIPSLAINPTADQLIMLDEYGRMVHLQDLGKAVAEKVAHESKMRVPGSFGPGYLGLRYPEKIDLLASLLDVSVDDIMSGMDVVHSVIEGRGSEFIKRLKES